MTASSKPAPKRARGRAQSPVQDGSGMRRKVEPAPTPAGAQQSDPELDARVFSLVTAVSEDGDAGFPYDPSWAATADAAKRRGYVTERSLKLYLAAHGRQWLASRAAPKKGARGYTMTKISPRTRLALKDIARETGVPMQEAIGFIIESVHENRDALTRAARRLGLSHPWEAIGRLVAKS